ncbi:hypothetical protein HZA96_04030 [Candidatus Woesearchaeota archaeon]|nr:hypothetical protein [Candidatus Woesearchaeota archaeon]
MKKILVVILLIAIIVVSVIGYKYISTQTTQLPSSLRQCDIIGKKVQYIKDGFIYFYNPPPDSGEYIYSDFAIFKRNLETGGWLVKPELNNENSLYNSTLIWINNKKYLDGTPIICKDLEKDEQLPPGFRQFIETHPIYFDKYKGKYKELE